MTTANDIITDALEKLGSYAPGETTSAADAARGLVVLNSMINQWNDEYLSIYQLTTIEVDLVAEQAAYTIGLTGTPDLAQSRPVRIESGPGAATVTIADTTTLLNVVSAVEWRGIESISPGSGIPDTLYYDPQYPNGVLNLAPTPSAIGTLTCYGWTPLRSFTELTDPDVTLSAGVQDALKTNLAVALKPYFQTAALAPEIMAMAVHSKTMLQQTNLTSRAMLGRGPKPIAPRPAAAALPPIE